MNERDFEVGGRKFKLNKLDAIRQFHIVRRLGPILGDLIPAARQLRNSNEQAMDEDQKFDMIAKFVSPIMMGISKLSDADANLVLLGLCSSVEVQQMHGNWAKISNGEVFMIQDLELPMLLQVAARAFMFNLSGFFALAPQVSRGK